VKLLIENFHKLSKRNFLKESLDKDPRNFLKESLDKDPRNLYILVIQEIFEFLVILGFLIKLFTIKVDATKGSINLIEKEFKVSNNWRIHHSVDSVQISYLQYTSLVVLGVNPKLPLLPLVFLLPQFQRDDLVLGVLLLYVPW
jgi:hypothetical protein